MYKKIEVITLKNNKIIEKWDDDDVEFVQKQLIKSFIDFNILKICNFKTVNNGYGANNLIFNYYYKDKDIKIIKKYINIFEF